MEMLFKTDAIIDANKHIKSITSIFSNTYVTGKIVLHVLIGFL